MYDEYGLDATVAYYNAPESVDGQWYVFIYDPYQMAILAHAPEPRPCWRARVGVRRAQQLSHGRSGISPSPTRTADGSVTPTRIMLRAQSRPSTHGLWNMTASIFGSGWYEPGTEQVGQPGIHSRHSFGRLSICTKPLGSTAPSPTTTRLRASMASGTRSSSIRPTMRC